MDVVWRSVGEKCSAEVLERSVLEKCCEGSVVVKCCSKVL